MFFRSKTFMVVLLIVVVGGAITLIFKPRDTFEKSADKKVIEDHSFTAVEVMADNAAIEIVPSKDSEVTVAYTGTTKKKAKYLFEAEVKGDTLAVQFKEKRKGFIHLGFSTLNITLTVSIPEKHYEQIQAETDNGRIKVENLQAGDLVLETDNGKVELKQIDATVVRVKTDNGRILLEDVEGKIEAKTDNGRISLITNILDRPIDLETDNGKIEIQTEMEPKNATIDAKSDNGRVELFGQENKLVMFGKGENLIKLRTDNGRITVTN